MTGRFAWVFAVLLAFALGSPPLAQAQAPVPAPAAAETPQPAPTQPSLDELVRILENDTSRAELLARLKNGAQEPADPAERSAQANAQAAEGASEPTIARQIAEYTRTIAQEAGAATTAIAGAVSALAAGVSNPGGIDWAQVQDVTLEVALVAVAVLASLLVLRLGAERIRASIARRVQASSLALRAVALAIATAVDALAVALAVAAGYILTINLIGSGAGRIGINQTLLLNAFLVVEMVKVGMRALLQPRHPALRLVPIADTPAAYWYFWTARLISLLGYAFMFVTPIVAATISYGAGQAVQIVAALTALITGILIVLQCRDDVRRALTARAVAGRHDMLSRSSAVLGRFWHYIAIFYLIALFVTWLVNPREALGFMVTATFQTLLIGIAGAATIGFISRFLSAGIRLPDDVRVKLPLLEHRLQAFVPRVLRIVRTLVLVTMAAAFLQVWGLIDIVGWIASDDGQAAIGAIVSAGLILLVGGLIYLAVSSWVEYRLNPQVGTAPTAREKTLLSLFRNAFTVALAVMVIMLALAQIGVNIGPLLAGAGVLGLAIGFGAQKLVQDIITGAFMQFENIINEGDVVELGGKSGVVEKLTIRSVSIRSLDGTLHLIPFSAVETVSNMMKGFAFHVAEIGVAYREDIEEVKAAMQEAFERLMATEHKDKIVGPLDMQGITQFGDSAITVRARIRTMPGAQWAAGRAYNGFIKTIFDERDIEMPYPHMTLYMGQDKAGKAPPLRLAPRPVLVRDGAENAGAPQNAQQNGTSLLKSARKTGKA